MNVLSKLAFLKSLPVQLIACILVAFYLGKVLDLFYVRLFFTLSSVFVEILLFILPIMVFSFIFRALVGIERKSTWLVGLILISVTISNILAVLTAYGYSKGLMAALGITHCAGFADKFISNVDPLFPFELPRFIGTDRAMLAGIACGFIVSFLPDRIAFRTFATNKAIILSDMITAFLQRAFIPLLPIYIFGFCLKLSYDDALVHLFTHYSHVFFASLTLVLMYISLIYFFGAGLSITRALAHMRTMLPAALTGFSTMSSAATMPVTLECTEKNTKDRNFTDLIIPSTANIHMLGDDLTITVTAVALLTICGHGVPDFMTFLAYAGAFSIAKLSCVGIPGASVLVVLPVLQQFLGFTPEMIGMLTTIYILQDSFGTAANVMGNGGFALVIQRVFRRLQK
ncbi:MAG: dicarboxylate/amino acid:cation symporter [Alphaproteobacteria bacterium]|nr:dicarboxylate/amino acid:cation symporter [Alphaproteobacteria bacterium]